MRLIPLKSFEFYDDVSNDYFVFRESVSRDGSSPTGKKSKYLWLVNDGTNCGGTPEEVVQTLQRLTKALADKYGVAYSE